MCRKILAIYICCLFLFTLVSCSDLGGETFVLENFHCKQVDNESIAIGTLSDDFSSNIIFVPQEINGYTVKKLGYTSGLGYGGFGYLTSISPKKYELERFYCPNTIEEINERYMYLVSNHLKVFYCGKVLNLGILNSDGRSIELYVPSELYQEFYNSIYENCRSILNKANLVYLLNYETDYKYYYIDNFDYGSKIEYIPPIPKRSGYDFIGWYTDANCTIEWIFEEDELPILSEDKDFIETKLYAKWQKK